MKDEEKTREQVVNELAALRQRVAELEAAGAERLRAEGAAQEAREYAESIVDTVREPLVVLDADLRVISANRSFYQTFQVTPEETEGQLLYGLRSRQWDIPRLRELLEGILPENTAFDDLEVEHEFPTIGRRTVMLNARRMYRQAQESQSILLAIQDVTERVQAEEALRESEERFRTAADLTHLWECWCGVDGSYLYISPSCERITGYRANEFLQDPRLLERITHADDQARIVRHVHEELESSKVLSIDFRVVTRSGDERWIGHICQPVVGDDGRYLGRRASNRDITERKKAEEALRQRTCELVLLNQAGQALTATLNRDEILIAVVEETRGLLGVTACSVWLIDPESGELVCQQAIGPGSEIVQGWRLAPGEGLAGWVARSGESLCVPDVRNDDRHLEGVGRRTRLPLRSILSVPLRIQRGVIGVLQAVDTRVGRFSATDLGLVEALVTTAAIAIENAQNYEQTRRDAVTKAALLNEANHRVKNNLTSIMGILVLEMQRPYQDTTDFRTVLRDIQSRILGMATVHDLLSETQWSPLPLDRLVRKVIHAALSGSPIRHKVEVAVTPLVERLLITPGQATGLALIVSELTTNTVKHAFWDRDRGQIEVRIAAEDEDRQGGGGGRKKVTLEFCDDGPGWPDDVLRGERENVGLNIVRMIVRSPLRGQLVLDNDGGAIARLTFTLAPID